MKTISILVPTFNEEENVNPLATAIIEQMSQLKEYDYELVFIDNDSKDRTREIIREMCNANDKIKAIFNARNYGQFNSPYYGITQCNGDCVIAMCADFQDPVEMIPKFLAEWENGYKIVLGQKLSSKENGLVYSARGFYYKFMKKHSEYGLIEQVTGFGLYDREFIELMKKYESPKPFIRGVVTEMGYKIKTIPYEQPKRRAGKSSNNFGKYYDAACQSFTQYTKTGIRLIMIFGILFSLASVATAIGCVIYKLFNWDSFDLMGISLQLAIFMAVSFQMVFIGIVGEYVLNINDQVKKRPLVIESERINF